MSNGDGERYKIWIKRKRTWRGEGRRHHEEETNQGIATSTDS